MLDNPNSGSYGKNGHWVTAYKQFYKKIPSYKARLHIIEETIYWEGNEAYEAINWLKTKAKA